MTATKILIVEDEPAALSATALVLQARGYATCTADDAVTAISTAVQEHPDLVVLDFGLPADSATVVLARLRHLPATAITPVIAVAAGRVDAERRQSLSALGCEFVLTKPVAVEDLLAAVSMSISERVSTGSGGPALPFTG